MSEKRFTYFKNPVGFGKQGIQDSKNYQVFDFTMSNVLDLLNELADENRELRQQLQEKQEDEKLYAQEIVKLNKEAKEVLNFKTLGSDY